MTNLKLSNNIYITGEDGKCYRHTVTFTPSSQIKLTQTKGVLFWKKEVPNPEALKAVEEHVHALALAHITQYGKDFQTVTINEAGATFDQGNTQTHDFSINESEFTQKMSKRTNQLATQKFDQCLKTQPSTHQAKHLFDAFAGAPISSPIKQPSFSHRHDDDSLPLSSPAPPDTDYPQELYELPTRSSLKEEVVSIPPNSPSPVPRANLDPLKEKEIEVRSLLSDLKLKLVQPSLNNPLSLPEDS